MCCLHDYWNYRSVYIVLFPPGPMKRVHSRNLFFLFLNQNICCGYSKEPSHRENNRTFTLKNCLTYPMVSTLLAKKLEPISIFLGTEE